MNNMNWSPPKRPQHGLTHETSPIVLQTVMREPSPNSRLASKIRVKKSIHPMEAARSNILPLREGEEKKEGGDNIQFNEPQIMNVSHYGEIGVNDIAIQSMQITPHSPSSQKKKKKERPDINWGEDLQSSKRFKITEEDTNTYIENGGTDIIQPSPPHRKRTTGKAKLINPPTPRGNLHLPQKSNNTGGLPRRSISAPRLGCMRGNAQYGAPSLRTQGGAIGPKSKPTIPVSPNLRTKSRSRGPFPRTPSRNASRGREPSQIQRPITPKTPKNRERCTGIWKQPPQTPKRIASVKSTVPISPNLHVEQRARGPSTFQTFEQREMQEMKSYKANPFDRAIFQKPEMTISKSNKDLTIPNPFDFATNNRSSRMFQREERKDIGGWKPLELNRDMLYKPTTEIIRPHKIGKSTVPQPFNMQLDRLGIFREDRKVQSVERSSIKPRGIPQSHNRPYTPKKRSRTPIPFNEFNLQTQSRCESREKIIRDMGDESQDQYPEFRARGMPNYSLKEIEKSAKKATKSSPFRFLTDARNEKNTKREAENSAKNLVLSNKIKTLGVIPGSHFNPFNAILPSVTGEHERIIPKEQHLRTDIQSNKHAQYIKENQIQMEMRQKHERDISENREKEEIKEIRKRQEFKAHDIAHYKPIIIKKTGKMTFPVTPPLATKARADIKNNIIENQVENFERLGKIIHGEKENVGGMGNIEGGDENNKQRENVFTHPEHYL